MEIDSTTSPYVVEGDDTVPHRHTGVIYVRRLKIALGILVLSSEPAGEICWVSLCRYERPIPKMDGMASKGHRQLEAVNILLVLSTA